MTGYDVRTARFDDLDARTAYALWQLRESVFVVEQACAYQELDGLDPEPATLHLWVEHARQPVAYLRIVEDAAEARIGRVLVAPAHRGRGLAAQLVRRALEEIGDRPAGLNAQAYLAGWYTTFGFAPVGPEFLEDGIPHVPMRRSG